MTRTQEFQTWLRSKRRAAKVKRRIAEAKRKLNPPMEATEMRNALRTDEVMHPAKPDWVLVAKRQVAVDGFIYPVGAVIPSAIRNLEAMLSSKFVAWGPRPKVQIEPRKLPEMDAPKPRPAVLLVDDADVCEAWRLSKQAMIRLCNGNAAAAMDLLLADPTARDLFKRATAEGCRREAKRRGVPSVSPDMVPGL
jgi:hypothetical protein